jgi:hypothetical protein
LEVIDGEKWTSITLFVHLSTSLPYQHLEDEISRNYFLWKISHFAGEWYQEHMGSHHHFNQSSLMAQGYCISGAVSDVYHQKMSSFQIAIVSSTVGKC